MLKILKSNWLVTKRFLHDLNICVGWNTKAMQKNQTIKLTSWIGYLQLIHNNIIQIKSPLCWHNYTGKDKVDTFSAVINFIKFCNTYCYKTLVWGRQYQQDFWLSVWVLWDFICISSQEYRRHKDYILDLFCPWECDSNRTSSEGSACEVIGFS